MKTIIIADEDVIVRKLINLAFPDYMDYRVVDTSTGADAIIKSKEIKPNVVIADVSLFDKDGYEVSREIKDDLTLEDIPVILLVSSLGAFDEIKAAGSRADDFMTKPFEPGAMARKVESLIAQHEKRRLELEFDSLFNPFITEGVFKTASAQGFEEFDENIAPRRESLSPKSLEIIPRTVIKGLKSYYETAKEPRQGFKRKVAGLVDVIDPYRMPKVIERLKAPLYGKRRSIAPLGLAIILPIIILAVFAHEREETVVSSSISAIPDEPWENPPVRISFPDGKSSDVLREVKLIGENIENQEKKESRAQEVSNKKEIRVSSRQVVKRMGKSRITGKRKPIRKHRVNSQSALAMLPADTPIFADQKREREIQSQLVTADKRKREIEKQLRTAFLIAY